MHTQKEILFFIVASTFLFFILVSFIITILLLNRQQQNAFLRELDLIKSNFDKELLKTQFEIQEEIFQHISLELHDNVSHFLSLAKLHLTSMKIPLAKEITESMDTAALLIGCSLDEVRNISKRLDTESIISNGLIKTMEQHIEQLKKMGHFVVHFNITGKTCYLDDQKEFVLFRIMQECISNIIKHSKADTIYIKLHYNEQSLFFSVQDNGIGFNTGNLMQGHNRNSSGLKNIIKRSALINANYEILSAPDKGTTINIITPY